LTLALRSCPAQSKFAQSRFQFRLRFVPVSAAVNATMLHYLVRDFDAISFGLEAFIA
jgi:hypothetical protein